ncbi:probable aldehyde oxidase 4 isoform X1 [Homalodisca vitripennis]|uniref:probable aldehyde oxidase 4 isoform X1 n=2 Tax=Homalodisca vitripennis TaxID=197043 RepID=UPI001EECD523|nr:probable aldehyde oxidase 4 isoform X1 [Homalodisca vitripennis]
MMEEFKKATSILINGKRYPVPDNLPANTSLNEFIRTHAHLKGTKNTCQEGGCGACIVAVKSVHPTTGEQLEYGVNSCLLPVFACADWEIITVEGVGNRTTGYHDVQARLAKGNGTQCGYCSVGMVMNMYSLLKSKPELTMEEIENSFGGNLCRCTGYRPILDSFKSFAKDAPKSLLDKCADIEDLITICPVKKKLCVRNGACNTENCDGKEEAADVGRKGPRFIPLQDGSCWYHPGEKKEIFAILQNCSDTNYMFVGGNTAHGVYRVTSKIKHYINLNGVTELHSIENSGGTITLGASTSLTTAMEHFYKTSELQPQKFGYLKELADHIDLIANVPVRNTGTLAGNLAIKNQHKEFPSDLFLILETVGAQIVVEDVSHKETILSPSDFVNFDMTKKLMTKIIMPQIDSEQYVCKTFKIMPRSQNAHAYVNAGFLFKVDKKDNFKVLEKPNIVFGGITPEFVS